MRYWINTKGTRRYIYDLAEGEPSDLMFATQGMVECTAFEAWLFRKLYINLKVPDKFRWFKARLKGERE